MINLALKRNLNTAAILLILQIKMKEESLCLKNDEVIIELGDNNFFSDT